MNAWTEPEPRKFALAVSLLLSLLSAPAAAQSSSIEGAVEVRRQDAKRSFEQGVEHYRQGRYSRAIAAFLEADHLAPRAELSYNIARAYERLDDTAGALRWYRDYLRRSPLGKNSSQVKERVELLAAELAERGVQQLTVLSTPVGAQVVIDGRAMGVTPFTGELVPGSHQVLLDLDGYRESGGEIELLPAVPAELNLSLQPRSSQEKRTAPAGDRQPGPLLYRDQGHRRFGVLPWLVAGAGAVGLGGALAFELARRADERDARRASNQLAYQDELKQMEKDQLRSRVLAGVGGGLFLTGGVLLLLNRREPGHEPARIGLGCTLRGCTALARGSF